MRLAEPPFCRFGIANCAEQLPAKDSLGTASAMRAGDLVDSQFLEGRLRETAFLAALTGQIDRPNPEIDVIALDFDLIAFVAGWVDAMDDLAGRQLLGPALDVLTASAGERDTRTEAVRSHGSGRNPFELDQRLLDLRADRAGVAKLRDTGIARFW